VAYVKGSHRWGQRFKPATFSGQHACQEALPTDPGDAADSPPNGTLWPQIWPREPF